MNLYKTKLMEIIQIHGKDILKFVKQSLFKWLKNSSRHNLARSVDTKYQ